MTPDVARSVEPFKMVCVVGLGNHARTKLIPALIANGQQIVGLVSTQSRDDLPAAPVFPRLEDALSAVPPETLFVLATPPAAHFEQVMAVIGANRDLVVEKPAFVTEREAIEAATGATRRGTVLVEAFMYRHTELYRRLLTYWRAERASVEAIEVTFLVPGMPPGSFRQGGTIASSSLYDIGSYALSLFADLGVPFRALDLISADFAGDSDREAVHLAGSGGGARLDIRLGVNPVYANSVSFRMADGSAVTFAPFFYGRPVERVISRESGSRTFREVIHESDAYREMFAVSRGAWLDNQWTRGQQMIEVTGVLQGLGEKLARIRNRITN